MFFIVMVPWGCRLSGLYAYPGLDGRSSLSGDKQASKQTGYCTRDHPGGTESGARGSGSCGGGIGEKGWRCGGSARVKRKIQFRGRFASGPIPRANVPEKIKNMISRHIIVLSYVQVMVVHFVFFFALSICEYDRVTIRDDVLGMAGSMLASHLLPCFIRKYHKKMYKLLYDQ